MMKISLPLSLNPGTPGAAPKTGGKGVKDFAPALADAIKGSGTAKRVSADTIVAQDKALPAKARLPDSKLKSTEKTMQKADGAKRQTSATPGKILPVAKNAKGADASGEADTTAQAQSATATKTSAPVSTAKTISTADDALDATSPTVPSLTASVSNQGIQPATTPTKHHVQPTRGTADSTVTITDPTAADIADGNDANMTAQAGPGTGTDDKVVAQTAKKAPEKSKTSASHPTATDSAATAIVAAVALDTPAASGVARSASAKADDSGHGDGASKTKGDAPTPRKAAPTIAFAWQAPFNPSAGTTPATGNTAAPVAHAAQPVTGQGPALSKDIGNTAIAANQQATAQAHTQAAPQPDKLESLALKAAIQSATPVSGTASSAPTPSAARTDILGKTPVDIQFTTTAPPPVVTRATLAMTSALPAQFAAQLAGQSATRRNVPLTPASDSSGDGQISMLLSHGAAAGQTTATALSGATGQDGTALDLKQQQGMEQMIDRIAALRDAGKGANDARIRLAPDALGNVQVTVRHDGAQTHVHFTTDTLAARTLLHDAQPRLAEMADARGLKLGNTTVDSGAAGQGYQSNQQQPQGQQQPNIRNFAPTSAADDSESGIADARIA